MPWRGSARHEPGRVSPLADEDVFAFAGIWQEINGEPAFVIMTTTPNELMEPIHNRMPIILEGQP